MGREVEPDSTFIHVFSHSMFNHNLFVVILQSVNFYVLLYFALLFFVLLTFAMFVAYLFHMSILSKRRSLFGFYTFVYSTLDNID